MNAKMLWQAARMQAVVDQEQTRSMSSMAARSFTIPEPLALAAVRSMKLRPSVRSIDEATLECAPSCLPQSPRSLGT